MSSGEEFEVEEILQQRKRKGVLEYLVRWRGFNDLYDSWEPASGLADCTKALKAFIAKTKRSRSKSRSRSRGRTTKSRSRSSSRGRAPKTDTTSKRSRSRSGGRKSTRLSSKSSTETTESKTVSSVEEQQKSIKLQAGTEAAEEKASTKSETIVEKTSTSKEGEVVERKTEVVKTTVETVKATPSTTAESSGMTTRSRLAVRQVQNDQKPPEPKAVDSSKTNEKVTWLWWFADHAVLILFIVVSVIALSFTIESVSGVRDKLVPDLGVLRQRLGESYNHFVQELRTGSTNLASAVVQGFNNLKAVIASSGDSASSQSAPPPQSA
ncbi:uncharacterized protein LOC143285493 [Babylonia areolata]|uniref:uncharacterized protein LOC143285489 n=1 Tax=Babylonia areolata TaxID=304850 RepID=UPI003FD67B4D